MSNVNDKTKVKKIYTDIVSSWGLPAGTELLCVDNNANSCVFTVGRKYKIHEDGKYILGNQSKCSEVVSKFVLVEPELTFPRDMITYRGLIHVSYGANYDVPAHTAVRIIGEVDYYTATSGKYYLAHIGPSIMPICSSLLFELPTESPEQIKAREIREKMEELSKELKDLEAKL